MPPSTYSTRILSKAIFARNQAAPPQKTNLTRRRKRGTNEGAQAVGGRGQRLVRQLVNHLQGALLAWQMTYFLEYIRQIISIVEVFLLKRRPAPIWSVNLHPFLFIIFIMASWFRASHRRRLAPTGSTAVPFMCNLPAAIRIGNVSGSCPSAEPNHNTRKTPPTVRQTTKTRIAREINLMVLFFCFTLIDEYYALQPSRAQAAKQVLSTTTLSG